MSDRMIGIIISIVFFTITVSIFFVLFLHLYCRMKCKTKIEAKCTKSDTIHNGYEHGKGFSRVKRYQHKVDYQYEFQGKQYTITDFYFAPYKEGPRVGQTIDLFLCDSNPKLYWYKNMGRHDTDYIILSIISLFFFFLSILS